MKALLNALQLQSKSKSKAVDIGSVRVQLKDLCSNMISYYTNLITLLCIDYTRLHSTLHSISVNYNRGVEEEDAHYDAATDPVLKDISRFKYIGRQKASLVTELISVEERLVIIFTKILKLQVNTVECIWLVSVLLVYIAHVLCLCVQIRLDYICILAYRILPNHMELMLLL